jgi:DNA-binding MarR family transcriptional regulator
MVTGGNVTGITDVLEREGLIARVTDPKDRRALRVRLTSAGQRLFKRMAAEHENWVIDLFDELRPKSKTQLAALLHDLKWHIREKTRH